MQVRARSERFVYGTERNRVMSQDLSGLAVVALLHRLRFAEHLVLAAVGMDDRGEKHVLGLREGATENAAAVRVLLAVTESQSLAVSRDGRGQGGSHGVVEVARTRWLEHCREHKKGNVSEALPERLRASVRAAMNQAYATRDPKRAQRLLENLARRLEHRHPGPPLRCANAWTRP